MAPPEHGTRQRSLMSVREGAYSGFDLHGEIRRMLWCAAGVLALVLLLAAKLS
jgi:hypothetical protein